MRAEPGSLVTAGVFVAVAWSTPAMLRTLRARRAARREGVAVSWGQAFGWVLRHTDARVVSTAVARARTAGVDLPLDRAEVHFLAGGDPRTAVDLFIAARDQGKQIGWEEAFAMDLSGRD